MWHHSCQKIRKTLPKEDLKGPFQGPSKDGWRTKWKDRTSVQNKGYNRRGCEATIDGEGGKVLDSFCLDQLLQQSIQQATNTTDGSLAEERWWSLKSLYKQRSEYFMLCSFLWSWRLDSKNVGQKKKLPLVPLMVAETFGSILESKENQTDL